jgi:hypothetical protein
MASTLNYTSSKSNSKGSLKASRGGRGAGWYRNSSALTDTCWKEVLCSRRYYRTAVSISIRLLRTFSSLKASMMCRSRMIRRTIR